MNWSGPATALAEGIQTLQPGFLQLPEAFAGLMEVLVQAYLQAVEAAGQQTDMAFLAPVVEVFQQLQAVDTPPPETGA